MSRIKILYIDKEGGQGGSSKSLYNLISSLNLKKIEPIVFCKLKGSTYLKLKEKGIKCQIIPSICSIVPLPKKNLRNWFVHGPKLFFINDLLKKIIDVKPDILHLNYEGLIPIHYFLLKKNFKVKTVLHFRSSIASPNFIYKIYANHINKNIDHLIFITENEWNIAKKGGILLNKVPNSIMYNTANISKIKKNYNKPASKYLRVIFLGILDKNKGAKRLIELAYVLKTWNIKLKIDVYGRTVQYREWFILKKNSLEEFRKKVKNKNLEKIITFFGYTNEPEEKLANSDILIRPSVLNDPWGRDTIEALSNGIPVITHGQYDKFVKNNFTGILLPKWNVYDYARSIKNINRKELNAWSQNALDLAIKNFNTRKYSKKITNIYLSLLN